MHSTDSSLQVEAPRRSPERTHITNFMRANSPEPPRRLSPVAKRSPLAVPPPPPVVARVTHHQVVQLPSPTDRPHSEPPKRKAYARDEVGRVIFVDMRVVLYGAWNTHSRLGESLSLSRTAL